MEEKSSASESDAFGLDHRSHSPWLITRPRACDILAPSSRPLQVACRASRPLLLFSSLTVAHSAARGDALERIRQSGRLLYGSDMEGGGPYAYPDPRSPRDVTGFEVELMARLGERPGRDTRVLAGSVGQAASSPRRRSNRPRVQRLRMDRDAGPRLPGDPPLLRLSVAVDGAARRPDPVLGRSQAAEAGRRALDRRRAGRVGGRHVRGRARRAHVESSGSTVRPTP